MTAAKPNGPEHSFWVQARNAMASFAGALLSPVQTLWGAFVRVLPLVVAALVLAVVFFAFDRPWAGEGPHRGRRILPNEYMYLDSARVDSYLGQLHEGDSSTEDVHETTSEEASLGFEIGKVGNASTHRGSQLERSLVVTKSEAERFYELTEALKAHKGALVSLDADDECQIANRLATSAVRDGELILIRHAVVQMPPFLAAYPELRYAGYRLLPHMVLRPSARAGGKPHWVDDEVFGRVPLTSFDTVDEATLEGARRERQSFESRVGKNPRIPFSFSVPADKQHVEACNRASAKRHGGAAAGRVTVVLPARFANLTGDPSLLSDPVTIVGLLASDTEGSFGDGLSASAYWPALRSTHARFLRQLGVQKRFLEMEPAELRRHLFGAMERSLTYRGHIVAVIPIAMYD